MSRHGFPVLGILGGGQLGRMTALAAIPMGIEVRFLVPAPAPPVAGLGQATIADWNDADVLSAFARTCDAVTSESEWAPLDMLADHAPGGTRVWPSPETLRAIRNKGTQKQSLARHGLPLAPFAVASSLEGVRTQVDGLGLPVVLKQPLGSYDGYGNATAHSAGDLGQAWEKLGGEGGVLVEAFVQFRRELAVIVARDSSGDVRTYPVAYTEQRDHRCHGVVVPAGVDPVVERRALEVAVAAVEAVDGVGVTGVELFETVDGEILVNELAPRPHNTGHYTIEACYTSQFENHVRAVLGLPLGDPSLRVPAACMINVLGAEMPPPPGRGLAEALAVDGASVHVYGKPESRAGRKMGHVTAIASTPAEARARAERSASLLHL